MDKQLNIYDHVKQKAARIFEDHGLLSQTVRIKARALSPEEAIGNPEGDDFPIQKGKERLMQADIRGSLGQAFTDRFGDYEGTLADILSVEPTNNYRRAVFAAAINAALRYLGRIESTVHCRDAEPAHCAEALAEHIQQRYGRVRITQVGYQPKMVETLGDRFELRVLDMDPDNLGVRKHGVLIEPPENTDAAVEWADLLVVTGTVLVNGTLPNFLVDKPVIFYGTTIAGAAWLMGWNRFCACGK
ncbi:MAG: DUF364 domain-containing protein [Desulfobacterales bacterium]